MTFCLVSPPHRRRRPLARVLARLCARLLAGWLAGSAGVQAQVSGALGVASQVRYRGDYTGDRGPALHASLMADAPWLALDGAYAGLAGEWRTRDAGLADAQALAGWSGRFNTLWLFDDADPGWGWDSGWRRQHYADGVRGDYSEAMLGLLAPAASARVWWAPHYFGFRLSSFYLDLEAHRRLSDRWLLFGHLGATLYPAMARGRVRPPSRTDALLGIGYLDGDWDWRLLREGRVSGPSTSGSAGEGRAAAWVGSASVAF